MMSQRIDIAHWLPSHWKRWECGFVTWCPPTPLIDARQSIRNRLQQEGLTPVRDQDVATVLRVNGQGYQLRDGAYWASLDEIADASALRIVLGFPTPARWPLSPQRALPPCIYGTLGLILATDRLSCVALQALSLDARAIQRQMAVVIQHAQAEHDAEQVMDHLNALPALMVPLRQAYGVYVQAPAHAARQETRWEHVLTHQRAVHFTRLE